MFRNIILKRTYNTLKSKNDEQANQALLSRLKNIPTLGERKVVVQGEQVKNDEFNHFTIKKLTKLITLHTQDPLIWSSSTLERIFNLPHDACVNLVRYTKPLVKYIDRNLTEPKTLIENPLVIDIGRMKSDENYLSNYKKLAFPKEDTIERRALE